ncbi:aspartyl/asparaginyl beta-hydroxylase domain-containing protein [Flavobacterium aquicola]|uniref:Quercetin dioxygenase-like cupin family protein n=1 Tax=Flavobacterium aquicola TaxID=1682742 RepID=A0A3E0EJH7_9FLAO|nr:aspartyl/asparaginyl beta-hydroxylase domain-containing protein [Flavobacterium aquicola]REG97893.1 quercetin dioxygenase-like cupin family protein [Flavobacterium aquicola]
MEELVRTIKFPFVFDKERLKKDVQKVLKQEWTDHYNKNGYSGKWTSIALMAKGGKSNEIFATSNNDDPIINTEILEFCDYFKEILKGFLFEKTTVRLLQLAVGAEIKPHTDNCLGYEDGCFRLHIPIITNDEVEFILDGNRIIMNEGECWYIDANFMHSVANRGTINRIHLVIDGLRNEWTDQLFFAEANPNQFIKPKPVMSDEEKKLVIAELQRMNSAVANDLIKEME